MTTLQLEMDDDLVALLRQQNQTAPVAAREMIVLELYRRGSISSGKAADLLNISRLEFIHHAAQLGVAHLDMTGDEWDAERRRSQGL